MDDLANIYSDPIMDLGLALRQEFEITRVGLYPGSQMEQADILVVLVEEEQERIRLRRFVRRYLDQRDVAVNVVCMREDQFEKTGNILGTLI